MVWSDVETENDVFDVAGCREKTLKSMRRFDEEE